MAQTLLTPMLTLSLNEQIAGGWTNKAIIKAADLAASPAGTTIQFNLQKVVAGTIVFNPSMLVVTPFIFSDASIVVGTASFGDGSSNTTYIAASNIEGTGATTPVAANAVYVDTTRTAVAYSVTTNSQLLVAIVVTATKNVNTCTAGELHVFWEQRNMNELAYPQQ